MNRGGRRPGILDLSGGEVMRRFKEFLFSAIVSFLDDGWV
jgi:hypothetical protein